MQKPVQTPCEWDRQERMLGILIIIVKTCLQGISLA
jgi:hypothetical protein